jgi:hypothetical protein
VVLGHAGAVAEAGGAVVSGAGGDLGKAVAHGADDAISGCRPHGGPVRSAATLAQAPGPIGRSARRADAAVMLATGSRRRTRCAHLRFAALRHRRRACPRGALRAPALRLRFSPPSTGPAPGRTRCCASWR